MAGPRLRLAAIGTDRSADPLLYALLDAGHQVEWPVSWDDVGSYSGVLLRLSEEDLADAISRLEERVTAQQIVIHTCLEVGAEPLLDLPAVGIAMHRLSSGDTIVDTNDEISATVASVLISELQGNPVPVPAGERRALARALELVEQSRKLQREALGSVRSQQARDLLDRMCGLY